MTLKNAYTLDGTVLEYFSVPKGSLIWAIYSLKDTKITQIKHLERPIIITKGFSQWHGAECLMIDVSGYCSHIPLDNWIIDRKSNAGFGLDPL